jgi:membrane protein insertase Oxa1/YidC/SpoIIIJ
MLAMIIFMGFSLVSALGVYWLVGALFSIAQTLITHAIMNRNTKKR